MLTSKLFINSHNLIAHSLYNESVQMCRKQNSTHSVTGPPGALLFDVKPDITLKESLELQFCSTCRLGHLLHKFPVIPVTFDITCETSHAIHGF